MHHRWKILFRKSDQKIIICLHFFLFLEGSTSRAESSSPGAKLDLSVHMDIQL